MSFPQCAFLIPALRSVLQLVFEFLILSPLVQNLQETIPIPAKDTDRLAATAPTQP